MQPHPLITFIVAYITGIVVMAIITRHCNANEKRKQTCLEPSFSLLSWIGVILFTMFSLSESSKDGVIAKFFNYTDKE